MTGSTGRYFSPLRYPGGKGKLANYMKLLLLKNNLVGHEYVEPFAGGASVALSLLYEEYVTHIHINDLNRGIFAFWHTALNDNRELCERVRMVPLTMQEREKQRAVYADPNASLQDLGLATFFLNRTNRSGIVSGGVIGGNSQSGAWKLDARFNKVELITRLQKLGRFRSRISVTQLDAASLLEDWTLMPDRKAFFYLDPPYYVQGGRLYDNFYTHADHEEIKRRLQSTPHPWVVSYDAAPEIEKIYAGLPANWYGLSYSAAERTTGAEVMYRSPMVRWPSEDPSGISASYIVRARKLALEA